MRTVAVRLACMPTLLYWHANPIRSMNLALRPAMLLRQARFLYLVLRSAEIHPHRAISDDLNPVQFPNPASTFEFSLSLRTIAGWLHYAPIRDSVSIQVHRQGRPFAFSALLRWNMGSSPTMLHYADLDEIWGIYEQKEIWRKNRGWFQPPPIRSRIGHRWSNDRLQLEGMAGLCRKQAANA